MDLNNLIHEHTLIQDLFVSSSLKKNKTEKPTNVTTDQCSRHHTVLIHFKSMYQNTKVKQKSHRRLYWRLIGLIIHPVIIAIIKNGGRGEGSCNVFFSFAHQEQQLYKHLWYLGIYLLQKYSHCSTENHHCYLLVMK